MQKASEVDICGTCDGAGCPVCREDRSYEQHEVNKGRMGWIGVDLDGTLAHYDGWRGETHIGEPVPAMLARVKRWLAEGKEVRIFTARFSTNDPEEREAVRVALEAWCLENVGQELKVTHQKDCQMIELWDDRAVRVTKNTGAVDPQDGVE